MSSKETLHCKNCGHPLPKDYTNICSNCGKLTGIGMAQTYERPNLLRTPWGAFAVIVALIDGIFINYGFYTSSQEFWLVFAATTAIELIVGYFVRYKESERKHRQSETVADTQAN